MEYADEIMPLPYEAENVPSAGWKIKSKIPAPDGIKTFLWVPLEISVGHRAHITIKDGYINVSFAYEAWNQFPTKDYDKRQEATMRFVVRACNNHDKLVKMLGSVLQELNDGHANTYNCDEKVFEEAAALLRAIEKGE